MDIKNETLLGRGAKRLVSHSYLLSTARLTPPGQNSWHSTHELSDYNSASIGVIGNFLVTDV